MYLQHRNDENLDPRRRSRTARSRDWASRAAVIGLPNLPQLIQRALVRLGIAR